MNRVEQALARLVADLGAVHVRAALVGGLAVSVRTEPRFTRDVDVAVSVANDGEAERRVRELGARGYRVLAVVEQEATGRIAMARLGAPTVEGLVVDVIADPIPDAIADATPVETSSLAGSLPSPRSNDGVEII